ncbi:tRNA lysidine(34) synthetase TilS [Xylanibacter ruminicola]|uniref:tRNA(Ile)-lysidine synthase n=1 Tax=Xylanibacter ruminicola TaxID=839 RepID=A0A1M6V0L4_XYLRU|nr:tRNA lysidine(34) synthetase TilS [Xylanibacter ruminicola]SHK75032.1 tRNA(Ile)-lysidine synthase [Xylanibacter ruminicola]
MLSRIQHFIEKNHLLDIHNLYLVGLSGGGDSVALMLILRGLGYQIEAAHCNFKLRGNESDRDENFVRELCKKHSIKLHVIHFDTTEYANLHKVSIEMAARDLRYGYFRQLCKDIGAEGICIAHHRDDAVETLLMNLLRGAGIHGLTGIRPKNDIIVRPLLCLSRAEITEYLDSIGQTYVTDSSNLVDDVLRNKIRLRVLPLLEEIAPGATANIDKTANYLREAEKVYDAEMVQEQIALKADSGEMMISYLFKQPSPSAFLHEWLMPLGFNSSQTEQILGAVNGEPGREFTSPTHTLVIDREKLIVEPISKPMKSIKIPEVGTYRYDESTTYKFEITDEINISKSAGVATVDADKVEFPLTVRPIENGDWFIPFGMTGRKLVSDYLTDRKFTILQKRRQLTLTDASGAIVWLVGCRTDNRFKVSSETTKILRITYKLD